MTLILIFIAISRLIYMVLLSCIVRYKFFLVSDLTASISLVKFSVSATTAIERCLRAPPVYSIAFAECNAASLLMTLVSSARS